MKKEAFNFEEEKLYFCGIRRLCSTKFKYRYPEA